MRQTNVAFLSLLTKIGNGTALELEEIQLIQSRFYLRKEADHLCPHGIQPFLTNNAVDQYSLSVLNAAENKIVSVAINVLNGGNNAEQEAFLQQKL